ncbi:hypothetical protein EE612_000346 [Oryza sativa]|uniref:DUF674 family protein n=2 Tax=Oryza TaxID=4527 RepID=A0A0E0FGE4_ORYNI|nr:hypothetical protein OsI_00449 [Oryza sativa Indica Group]KAB8080014.1 hypothetical protein EE612_000346 [Oryza sativa]
MGNAAAVPSSCASADAAPSTTPTIKLLIAKEAQVVLFAEAGKDVVDFLVGLLAMPVGAVVKLLAGENALGGVANVYASVRRMDAAYMQSAEARDALLNPAPAHPCLAATAGGFPSLVQPPRVQAPYVAPPPPPPPPPGHPAYQCSTIRPTTPSLPSLKAAFPPFGAGMSSDTGCRCSTCLAAAQTGKGFVRDVVTYTVMDDLTFMPMSSISSIALLSKLGVEDLSALEEKTVKIGYQEGLEILKASLQSKTVLTDVFLNRKKKARAGDKHHRSGDKNVDARATGEKKDAAAAVQMEKSAPPMPHDFDV